MGAHLADRYGTDYYAFGFEFGRGAFQAKAQPTERGEEPGYELGEHRLETPLPDTLGGALTDQSYPPFVLDFETARRDRHLRSWVEGTHRLHSIGAIFRRDELESHREAYPLADAFDGLCYVAETTRARPLDRG